jgi:tRNA (guanosine-2'-O-)-methyltransferase
LRPDRSPSEIAVDRRTLAASSVGKTSKWPRTERRQNRIASVLRHRQPDLTVVLENVHDPHNVSAVLRSCDAVGVQRVHLIYTTEEAPKQALSRTTSASAAKWIEIVWHDSVAECYWQLRKAGFSVFATALNPGARDLYEVDLRKPTAVVFGNEMRGLSDEAVQGADAQVVIPVSGMVQSLNISVACAVTLYEAFRQRRESGHYRDAKLPEDEIARLAEVWLRK